jgi:hypothetical protein
MDHKLEIVTRPVTTRMVVTSICSAFSLESGAQEGRCAKTSIAAGYRASRCRAGHPHEARARGENQNVKGRHERRLLRPALRQFVKRLNSDLRLIETLLRADPRIRGTAKCLTLKTAIVDSSACSCFGRWPTSASSSLPAAPRSAAEGCRESSIWVPRGRSTTARWVRCPLILCGVENLQ